MASDTQWITSTAVTIASGTNQLKGFLARPRSMELCPAIVVIHEAYGLTENIQDVTQRFAGEGYFALAVDLFSNRNQTVCMARLFGGMMTNAFDHFGIHDLKASLGYLAEQPGVDKEKLGAIGFCLGGGLAIAWACTDKRLKAVAPFYGINPRPLTALERACPIVGSYPENDFTAGAGRKLGAALDKTTIAHDIKVYPGAKHSFFNDKGANYNVEAATDSWARVVRFFKEQIG